ncbi:hypothetical protein [Metallibacterium sp.]|uniref:hypothetical protein n=1 Tax=Metallibacterium sp. TaxID=2940281 RepID=UPI0026131F7E|nr:hypothetical protein [Metallibacterium sp.]
MCKTDTISGADEVQVASISSAYELVAGELRGYLAAHHAARIASPATGYLAPLGIEVTTGGGKSHAAALAAAIAQALGVPVLILVPTLALADDYVQAIAAAGGHAVRYVSRQSPEAVAADPELRPWLCRQLEAVRVAGERNQRPAMSICRECPFGRAAEYRCGNHDREQRALAWFRAHGLDPMDYQSCDFLYNGLPRVKASPIIVAHAAAFSETLATLKIEGGSVQRLVIVDESISLGKLVIAGQKSIEQWIKRIASIRARAVADVEKWRDIPSMADDRATWRQIVDLCDIADEAYRQLSSALALRQAPDLVGLQKLLSETRRAEQIHAGVAAWERVARAADGGDAYSIPLRALSALVASMRAGVARALPTAVEFFEPSPILQWAKERGSVAFMDATMPAVMRAIIDQLGGRTVRAIARQNLMLSRITGCSYSRGIVGREGFPAHARAIWRDLEAAAASPSGGAWAQIGHLAHVVHAGAPAYGIDADAERKAGRTNADIAAMVASAFQAQHGVALGWWGRHDRGHNLWSGRHLRIFGLPLLGMQTGDESEMGGSLVQEWRLARAAAIVAGCDPAAWPEVIGEMDSVRGRPPLPVDPRVRGWLIDRYAGDLVQAIGRTRAARSSHVIRCELWGGIDCPEMDQALARHGLTVETRWPNEVHRTERGRPRQGGQEAIQAAIEAVRQGGVRVTVRAVAASLRAAGAGGTTAEIAVAVRANNRCYENTIRDSKVISKQESKAPPTLPRHVQEEEVVASQNAEKEKPAPTPTPAPAPAVAANDDEAAEDAAFARFWNRAHGRVVIAVPAGVAP